MAVVAGIDEAGYGPILGPLVVSRAAFEVPEAHAGSCLWKLLRNTITAHATRRCRKLPIVDSKKLYHRQEGIAALEKTALTLLACCGSTPQTVAELLERLCPQILSTLQDYPWYQELNDVVPLAASASAIALKANAVLHDLRRHDIEFLDAGCSVLAAGQYNQLVGSTRNKATVLWACTLRQIHHLVQHHPGKPLYVFIDRQGARQYYTQALLTAFEGADLQVVLESADQSHYRLHAEGRTIEIQFLQEGEDRKLPIALASIYSKYTREVLMRALNRYWQQQVDRLKRTAGYYQDGQRFLKDIESAVQALAVDRRLLVRSR